MSNRTKFILFPTIAVLVLSGVFFFFIFPRLKVMDKAHNDMANYKKIIESSTVTMSDLSMIEVKLAQTRSELSKIEAKLPSTSEFAKVIAELSRMSSKFKIQVNTINPIIVDVKGEGERHILKKRYIEMDIKCRFQVFGRFIETLYQLPTLFVVEDFSIDREDDIYPNLKIKLLLAVYMVEE